MAHGRSVADALEEYAGRGNIGWSGKQLVRLHDCSSPARCEGFHYRVDGILPDTVAAPDFIPEIGVHHISLALVRDGKELKPSLSFFTFFL
ncbi:MAG: hypothetical protein Q7S63_02280 [bacterium]|nr:hypothetical protein [bacterium]